MTGVQTCALPICTATSTTGATGGNGDQVFFTSGQTVTTSYTIPSGKSAMSVGPITIGSGYTVTVNSGVRWVIL